MALLCARRYFLNLLPVFDDDAETCCEPDAELLVAPFNGVQALNAAAKITSSNEVSNLFIKFHPKSWC